MWKKIGLWGLGLLVVCLALLGQQSAQADDLTSQFNNLSKPSAVYLDGNDGTLGQKVTTDDPMNYQFETGQTYNIVYDFTVADNTHIKNGDTVNVPLPINLASKISSFAMVRDPDIIDSPIIATFSRAEGDSDGTIKFTHELENDNTFTAGKLIVNTTGTVTSGDSGTGGVSSVIAKVGGVASSVTANGVDYPVTAWWSGFFNPADKNMGEVTLTDRLGKYLTFDSTTFSASEPATDTEPEVQLQDGKDYTISDSGSEINIVFKNIKRKVNYSYTTDVNYSQILADKLLGGYLSNYIELAAEDGESGSEATVPGSGSNPDPGTILGNAHKDAHWGASGSGYLDGGSFLGQVCFTKLDETDVSRALKGATYTLQRENADGLTWSDQVTNYTTNSDGQILIPSLPVGTYRFKETQAPEGYRLNQGDAAFSDDFTIATTDGTAFVHNISQSDVPFKVTLTKRDKSSNKVLQGAVYKIYKSDDLTTPVNKLTYKTDENGQLTVSPIAKGSYDFIEQTPPAGYKRDQTPIPFTISETTSTEPNEGPKAVVSQKDESSVTPTPTPGGSSGSSSSSSSGSSSSSSSSSSSTSAANPGTPTKTSKSSESSTTRSSHGDKVGSTPIMPASSSNRGGGAGTITANQVSAKRHQTPTNTLLPKTSEAKSIFAAIVGLLVIGGSLSIWQYRRTRQH